MKALRVGVVSICAMVLTTLGITASDTLTGSSNALVAQLFGVTTLVCPSGMVEIKTALTFTCVDAYEAQPNDSCLLLEPKNSLDTEVNLGGSSCAATSEAKGIPWRFITRAQAEVACARAGKRLPTATEWYHFALDTPEEVCNIAGPGVVSAEKNTNCVSARGVYHAVGNVWEWVSDDVVDGVHDGRSLPTSGYVTESDRRGIATVTSTTSSGQYGNDYFWSATPGVYGIVRGGFYDSKREAGVYAVLSNLSPAFAGEAVGFRCVQ